MKKHIFRIAVIATLFIGLLGTEASVSASTIDIVEIGDFQVEKSLSLHLSFIS